MAAVLPYLTVLVALSVPQQVETLMPCLDGERARVAGRHAEAVALYSRCIDQGVLALENLTSAYVNRGLSYAALGETEAAIADYDAAIAVLPEAPEAYVDRGLAFAFQGEPARAMADYEQALALAPDLPEIYVNRGLLHAEEGRIEAAVADYDQALALDPSMATAYYNRGTARYLAEDYARARDDYGRALRHRPSHRYAYLGRGVTHFVEGTWGPAARDLRRALARAPDYAYAALLTYVAEAHLDLPLDREMLEPHAEGDTWPAPAAALLLGRITPEAALAAAGEDPGHRCEAAFYAAEYHRMRDNQAAAVEMLRAAVATGQTSFVEFRSATRALEGLAE